MVTAAETIAGWSSGLRLEDIPPDVVEHAKLHVLDALGCGLAAHATGVYSHTHPVRGRDFAAA